MQRRSCRVMKRWAERRKNTSENERNQIRGWRETDTSRRKSITLRESCIVCIGQYCLRWLVPLLWSCCFEDLFWDVTFFVIFSLRVSVSNLQHWLTSHVRIPVFKDWNPLPDGFLTPETEGFATLQQCLSTSCDSKGHGKPPISNRCDSCVPYLIQFICILLILCLLIELIVITTSNCCWFRRLTRYFPVLAHQC